MSKRPKNLRGLLALFALLMLLDVLAFLLQKTASEHAAPSNGRYLQSVVTHLWAWAAFALAPLQLWTWTRILSRTDMSFAYPLTAVSVPLTMLASTLFLHERPPWPVWLGALLITAGASILKPQEDDDHGASDTLSLTN